MFAMLRIVLAGVIADSEMSVVEPIYLRIVKPAWTLVPEYNCVPTAPRALQCYLGVVTTEEPCFVAQTCFLTISRPNRSGLRRWATVSQCKPENNRRKGDDERCDANHAEDPRSDSLPSCTQQPSSGGPSHDTPHRERSSDAAQTCLAHDDALQDRDDRTPCRRIHRALRPTLAGRRNTRHPAVSVCSRSRRGPGRIPVGTAYCRPGPHSSKPYSFVFSLKSFSRMNASISGALARMRSHCSL